MLITSYSTTSIRMGLLHSSTRWRTLRDGHSLFDVSLLQGWKNYARCRSFVFLFLLAGVLDKPFVAVSSHLLRQYAASHWCSFRSLYFERSNTGELISLPWSNTVCLVQASLINASEIMYVEDLSFPSNQSLIIHALRTSTATLALIFNVGLQTPCICMKLIYFLH